MIPVTKPYLPSKKEYDHYLSAIWSRNWLTNHGPLVNELEIRLKKYLNLDHLLFLSNGTVALQVAIKALNLKGEIITTPFSYVATTSSIVWEGCRPVFVDIDQESLNIDSSKIEEAITQNTSAILATHVYGNPCSIETITSIAQKHQLKVIYDAAHCFGTNYNGQSVYEFGDISTASFHATKLFHTVEGGAVITKDPVVLKKMSDLRNFGHDGPEDFAGLGINGKNSELHAAMGLCVLNNIEDIIEKRKIQWHYYKEALVGENVAFQKINKKADYNHSYFPVIFDDEKILLKVKKSLEGHLIYPRRYFFPALNQLPYVDYHKMPKAESISGRVLCLPLFHQLSTEEQDMICKHIKNVLRFV
jgi:dTDP-4-amino-4,6-dideoxygalactose transaminase